MIEIDRNSNQPVYDQLVEQLRYLIAAGKYTVGDLLPSTRALGRQLDISFHTVRKAYRALEEEGIVSARVGSGYRIEERAPLDKADRIERGASVVQEALQRLIGLGLTEQEIDYVLQEQLTFFETVSRSRKIVVVAPYRELGEALAEDLSGLLQEDVTPLRAEDLARHHDIDVAVSTYPLYREVRAELERAQVFGCGVFMPVDCLAPVAELHPHETLGLVVRYADAIEPLSGYLRAQTGFRGQITATLAEAAGEQLTSIVHQTDLLLFTPTARRRLLGHLEDIRHVMIRWVLDPESARAIKQMVST